MTDVGRRRGMTFATLLALIAVAALAAALTGCAVGPNYVKPAAPVAPQFAGATDGPYSGEDVQAGFWTQFRDPTLDRLIDQALVENHDLRIALGNLIETRAERREAQFDLAPTVTASGGYTKERFPAVDSPTGEPLTQRFYDAGFDAFWELDFFGRIRRNIEARGAEVQGAEASLRDAQVSVTAEVARTYFELRGEQARFAVAWRNVENQRATLQLTQARLEAGRSTELDTARAQAQLSATLSTLGPLEAAIARSIHRLSVLTGQQPGALREPLAPAQDLPALPQIAAVGDPAGLLRRRP
ncbi:MAG TPA: TolC family protein, partial [Steroidobacteraceae bacterium]